MLLLTPLPTLWYYHPEIVKNFVNSIGIYYNTQLNQYLGTFVFQFIFTLIAIECMYTFFRKRNKKNTVSISSETPPESSDKEENIA